jgi:hypothetical protein
MAGGPAAIAERALIHLKDGAPEKALHLIEMAVAAAPFDHSVRQTELAILDALADGTQGRIFDLMGWLEGRIMAARKALHGAAQ